MHPGEAAWRAVAPCRAQAIIDALAERTIPHAGGRWKISATSRPTSRTMSAWQKAPAKPSAAYSSLSHGETEFPTANATHRCGSRRFAVRVVFCKDGASVAFAPRIAEEFHARFE